MGRSNIYQLITIILIIAVIASLGVFIFNLTKGKVGRAALSADVVYDKASVVINGKDKGETPHYSEDLYAGSIEVELNGQSNSYSTSIRPSAGTLAVVKRDLGINKSFSSGQNIWFDKSGGEDAIVSVISPDVQDVLVIVDGVEMGKTPIRFSTKDLLEESDDGKYKLNFKKEGYEDQEVDVKVRQGYTLTIRTDMFLIPVPVDVGVLQGLPEGVQFVNFSNVDNAAFADKQGWAKAVNYWMSTRGTVTFGNNKVEKISYFFAPDGKIYNDGGQEISSSDVSLSGSIFVAYLGSTSQKELTEEANTAISEAMGEGVNITEGVEGAEQVKLLTTGWAPNGVDVLRVRSGSGSGNSEVARAETNKAYKLLDEQNGWYKIEYEEGKEGWVSSTYAEKL